LNASRVLDAWANIRSTRYLIKINVRFQFAKESW